MSVLYASQKADELNIPCADIAELTSTSDNRCAIAASGERVTAASSLFRRAILSRLAKLQSGQLTVVDRSGAFEFGQVGSVGPVATINVNDHRFYRDVVMGGGLGAAESYIRGYWDSPDLTTTMRVLAQNSEVLSGVEKGAARLLRPLRAAANWLRRNTRAGSKRNISAHYDLSNDFFALMLDPTMTYSSGVFPSPTATLEEASIEKYDRICRKLQLTPEDHSGNRHGLGRIRGTCREAVRLPGHHNNDLRPAARLFHKPIW